MSSQFQSRKLFAQKMSSKSGTAASLKQSGGWYAECRSDLMQHQQGRIADRALDGTDVGCRGEPSRASFSPPRVIPGLLCRCPDVSRQVRKLWKNPVSESVPRLVK